MNNSLDLARQVAEDRRVRYTDRHPKASWNRRERRTMRVAVRRNDLAILDHGY